MASLNPAGVVQPGVLLVLIHHESASAGGFVSETLVTSSSLVLALCTVISMGSRIPVIGGRSEGCTVLESSLPDSIAALLASCKIASGIVACRAAINSEYCNKRRGL